MKKRIYLFLVILGLSLTLLACTPNEEDPIVNEPDVVSVEITNAETNLIPGSYNLVGKALPEGSNQQVRFTLVGEVEGVSLNNAELTVSVNALNGTVFTVRVTSIYDPSISSTKNFTVNNPSDVTEISNEAELIAAFADGEGLSGRFILTDHIVLTKAWDPIGTPEIEEDNGSVTPGKPFIGLFDGAGFTISNIQVNGTFNAGFFAQIGQTGIVRNIHLQGSVNATGWSGGVVGINEGLITNVISEMDVTVAGTSAGALVSVNRGTISYSYAIGKAESSLSNDQGRSAGLVVANDGVLNEVYGDRDRMTTQNYIAFVPSINHMYIRSTADMKKASTFANFDSEVWFLEDGFYPLLKHEGFIAPEKEVSLSITNGETEFDVELANTLQIGVEVVNGDENTLLSYRLTEEVLGVSIDSDGLVTFTNEIVNLSKFTVEVYLTNDESVKASLTFTILYNPVPTEEIVYITDEDGLTALATQTNPEALAKTYILSNDIALEGWYLHAIGSETNPFTGTFDGNGYTISGLKGGDGKNNFGMFGYIGETGLVKNFSLLGAERETDLYVGAGSAPLASANYGVVENIFVELTILSTGNWVSGLVANNYGTISNAIVRTKVSKNESLTTVGPAVSIDNEGVIENVFVDQEFTGAVSFLNAADAEYDAFLVTESFLKTAANFSEFNSNIWTIIEGSIPTLSKGE